MLNLQAVSNPSRTAALPQQLLRAWRTPVWNCKISGAANRTRTCDPVITNDVLYQLSYCGEPSIPVRSVFSATRGIPWPSGSLENART